jgi:hypothetical protein
MLHVATSPSKILYLYVMGSSSLIAMDLRSAKEHMAYRYRIKYRRSAFSDMANTNNNSQNKNKNKGERSQTRQVQQNEILT